MNNPKILVAAPTYSIMKYCDERFLSRIKALTYPNYDILIVDNSRENSYFKEIQNQGINVIHDNPQEQNNMKRLVSSRNKIIRR